MTVQLSIRSNPAVFAGRTRRIYKEFEISNSVGRAVSFQKRNPKRHLRIDLNDWTFSFCLSVISAIFLKPKPSFNEVLITSITSRYSPLTFIHSTIALSTSPFIGLNVIFLPSLVTILPLNTFSSASLIKFFSASNWSVSFVLKSIFLRITP